MSPAQINQKYSSSIVFIKTDAGTGTGFIISPEGVIATAFHVIDGAKKVGIKTANGEVFDQVLLLAKDDRKDVAILKIAGYDLPSLERGNSNEVKVGEHVTVIGNPLGEEALRSSVTDGVISGLRDLGWGYKLIQMSAPISPGNSGGPVFSERGQVIGIAVLHRVDGDELNFAVPVNYLSGLLDIADKTHPLQTWTESGSESLFTVKPKSEQGLSGYWKSTCGGILRIQDMGANVRVLNVQHTVYTYDVKWNGKVVFGTATAGDDIDWVLYEPVDSDHLNQWRSGAKHRETEDQGLARLRSRSEKERPECRLVKIAD